MAWPCFFFTHHLWLNFGCLLGVDLQEIIYSDMHSESTQPLRGLASATGSHTKCKSLSSTGFPASSELSCICFFFPPSLHLSCCLAYLVFLTSEHISSSDSWIFMCIPWFNINLFTLFAACLCCMDWKKDTHKSQPVMSHLCANK